MPSDVSGHYNLKNCSCVKGKTDCCVRSGRATYSCLWKGKTKNLVFGEPPPLVDDSKNIWVAQFQHAYRAFWGNNWQILYKGGYVNYVKNGSETF